MLMSTLGGITYTWLGSTSVASVTWLTGISVAFASSSVSALLWLGSRCWTSTYAISVPEPKALRNCVNASKPPAEAPTPTIGNKARLDRCGSSPCSTRLDFSSAGPPGFILGLLGLREVERTSVFNETIAGCVCLSNDSGFRAAAGHPRLSNGSYGLSLSATTQHLVNC